MPIIPGAIQVEESLASIAADTLTIWREHPAAMVEDVFHAEPDFWQREVLEVFPHEQRIAMLACKGPGKSTTLSWVGWNFLLTRKEAKAAVVSITEATLTDTLWAEMAKWQAKSPLLSSAFRFLSMQIQNKKTPETCFMSARTWPRTANPQQQADTLAGLHGDEMLIMMDEAGGIPRAVLATADAALSGTDKEGRPLDQHLVIAGNPTNQDSALGQACINERADWYVKEITGDPDDPKRAKRVSLKWAKKQIETYGRDNPWVLVNVFGKFPPGGLNTLLSPQDVIDAQKRAPAPEFKYIYEQFPLVLGVDVARFGDDGSVLSPRQGRLAMPPTRLRNVDTIDGAGHVNRMANDMRADSIQIDVTGGYGGAWQDQLRLTLNRTDVLPVVFSGKASNPARFANKRAEIWWLMAEWVKDGGILPVEDIQHNRLDEMVLGLSTVTYSFRGDAILVEEKQQIKDRIGRSPDWEDALACTFAHPVQKKVHTVSRLPPGVAAYDREKQASAIRDYDPYQRFADESDRD